MVYGAEKDYSSLSTIAAMEADKYNGITIGITYGKTKDIYGEFCPTVLIPCGLEVGGGREFNLVLACDVIIAIGGGSGTLTEMAIAYQANIPIVTINNFKGWARRLSEKYLDERKRLKCIKASTPSDALSLAIKEIEKRGDKDATD